MASTCYILIVLRFGWKIFHLSSTVVLTKMYHLVINYNGMKFDLSSTKKKISNDPTRHFFAIYLIFRTILSC